MREYKKKKGIYLQVADFIIERILSGDLKPDKRIPSIRDMASRAEVNMQTIVRTYNYLHDNEIVYNQRGIGFFVAKDAYDKVYALKRKVFMEETLPEMFKMMKLLKIDLEEVMELYRKAG